MDLAGFVLGHLAVIALIVSTALTAGLPWIRRLSMTAAERAAVATALGLGVTGHVVLGLGLAGRLAPAAVVALVLVAHLAGWRDLAALLSRAWCAWGSSRAPWLGAAGVLLAVAPLVLCALYPPTGFDATLYHLPYARAFARTHALPFLPDLRFPVFPQLVEAVFAAVLTLAGDVATHGVSLVATLATALLVAGWGRRVAGPVAGGLAGAIVLGQPVGVHLGSSAYVEPALGLFAVAAVYSAERWRAERDRGWLLLAGGLAGTAASTKYLGLAILAGVSIVVAVVSLRRGAARDVPAYAAVVAAALAITYGRLLHHTGSPLFPFLPEVFGSTPWDLTGHLPSVGLRYGVALLTLPWDVVFNRQVIGGMPPFNPLLSLGLPLVLVFAWRNRDVRSWVLWAVGFVLLAPVRAHYLWTVVPFLALAFGVSCARALERLRVRGAGRRAWAVVSAPALWMILCVLPGPLYGAYHLARLGPLPAGPAAREAFLARRLPLYPAVRAVNARCGERCTLYAVHAEHMAYFAAGRFLGDWNGPASFARTLVDADPRQLAVRLRRLGADHLLVPAGAQGATGLSGADAPGFRRVYADPAAAVYEVLPVAPGDSRNAPSSR